MVPRLAGGSVFPCNFRGGANASESSVRLDRVRYISNFAEETIRQSGERLEIALANFAQTLSSRKRRDSWAASKGAARYCLVTA